MLLFAAGTAAAASPPLSDHKAKIGDVELHYVEAGSGNATPVILLHGFAQTSHMWLPLIPKIDGDRKVIAVDLRGAGDSSKPASGYDKKTMAEDIRALAKSLGFKR